MLCIIFTKKKLLAGVKAEQSHLLEINGNGHIDLEGKPAFIVLEEHLADIVKSYKAFAKDNGISTDDGISASVAFPVSAQDSDREGVVAVLEQSKKHNISFIHGENIVVSFITGLKDHNKVSGENHVVLECMDDFTSICYHVKDSNATPKGEVKDIGREALFYDENFSAVPFKDLGVSAGNESVLNELITEFSGSGLTVDVKGQTELALQLMNPSEDFRFTVSKHTDLVSIEAEIKLTEDKYKELLVANRSKLGAKLSEEEISGRGIENVVLLGDFLHNKALQIYFEEELKLNGKLYSVGQDMDMDEYNLIIDGLAYRTMEVLEAEKVKAEEIERRRLEEEKRNQIASELKVKEDRESLLKEIRENCVDPAKKEEYEEMYIARGESLQIPDVVIKWNIAEVLSAIELKQEKEKISINLGETKEEEEVVEETVIEDSVEEDNSTDSEEEVVVETVEEVLEEVVEEVLEEEPEVEEEIVEEPTPEPVMETSPNGKEVTPEPQPEPELVAVAASAETQAAPVAEAVVEEVIDESFPEPEAKEEKKSSSKTSKKEESGEEVSPENRNWVKEVKGAKMSLNDLFLIKGALKDPEFSTKKVTLYADHEPKVVKVLTSKEVGRPEKVSRFLKLYEKELSYYQEMSELGVAKEGLYYFRDFIERTTLKDYVNKIGLDKKLSIEELTSSELKFILQVFKEVRELSVPHANLSEDNILVVSKRKWNLQKNVEIKFIGFTADESDEKGMIEEAHKIFSRLMGKDFYADFREKFQL